MRSLRLAAAMSSCALAAAPLALADVAPAAAPAAAAGTSRMRSPPQVINRSHRAEMWYAARFGIDEIRVHTISSGASVEFRYRVLDADKAAVLSDRNATPYLIDEETGVRLEVPVLEKIGALRQTAAPQPGKEYWMIFANRGKLVKAGRRVDVNCGAFHIRGLTVE
jgi:hypothetical protein